MVVVSMYVSGGLIPYYFVIRGLGLINHFLVYIIPFMLNAFYVLITRTFIDELPDSLVESAQIDGANDFIIYLRVILPLSLPIIATLILFTAVDQWNSWYDTYIYTKGTDLTTLQYELVKVLSKSTSSIKNYRDVQSKLTNGCSDYQYATVHPHGDHRRCHGSDSVRLSLCAAVFYSRYDAWRCQGLNHSLSTPPDAARIK